MGVPHMLSVSAAMAPGSPHLVRAPAPPGARHVMSGPSSGVSSLAASPMLPRSRPSVPGSAVVTPPGGFHASSAASGWGNLGGGDHFSDFESGHYSLTQSPGTAAPQHDGYGPRASHAAPYYNDSRA